MTAQATPVGEEADQPVRRVYDGPTSSCLGAAIPVDDLLKRRLVTLLKELFEPDIPLLDEHLALMDRRGALLACASASSWSGHLAEEFFGVMRHLVYFQADGPAPRPDVEGWLDAGRPSDSLLAAA